MSFDVDLINEDGDIVQVESHTEGGTYAIGGIPRAELNITYNYASYYYDLLDEDDGLRAIDGDPAHEWIDIFEDAVEELGTERASDYWDDTPGNAGHALNTLLGWMEEHPEARFRVI